MVTMPRPEVMSRRRRRSLARNEATLTQSQDTILETGLNIWSGVLDEEYLYQLRDWQVAFKVYTEMVDDAVIGGMLEAIKTPMLGSRFQIRAGSNSNEDMKIAERFRDDLFSLQDVAWIDHVEDMLEFLDYGFSLSEKKLAKNKDGYLHIDVLQTVGQETLDRWGPLTENGDVAGFIQRTDIYRKGDEFPMSVYGTKIPGVTRRPRPMHSAVYCPHDKLLHFTFKGRKRNPQGRSLLRSLYRAWYFKKNLESLEAIGVERDVGNAPVAKLAENVRYTDENIAKLQAALEGFRMDEALYVILPPGVELEAYGGGNKVYNVREIIRDYQHIIRQRFFADFLSLGAEGVGTQALATEMTTFFALAMRSIQERMLEVWNRQLIPWVLKYNEIDVPPDRWPTIDWLNPGESNMKMLSQAYQLLVRSGLLIPDKKIRDRIRLMLGQEPEEEDLEEQVLEKKKKEAELMAPPDPTNGVQADGRAAAGSGQQNNITKDNSMSRQDRGNGSPADNHEESDGNGLLAKPVFQLPTKVPEVSR